MTDILVEQLAESTRVDKYLAGRFQELSRSLISNYCKENLVSLKSGKHLAAGDVLKGGEELVIRFDIRPIQASAEKVQELGIKIVYRDDQIIVLEKPSGMPSVTLAHSDPVTVADNLLKIDPNILDVTEDKRESGLIHRLDTASSGLMIAARTNLSWQFLREELKEGQIKKSYLSLTQGTSHYSNFSQSLYLSAKGKKVRVEENEFAEGIPTSSKISTTWSGQFNNRKLSLIKVEAPFAKRHQVRAHLAYLEHPLVGDRLYGASFDLKDVFKDVEQEFILHADYLKFKHPIENKILEFHSENDLLKKVIAEGKK